MSISSSSYASYSESVRVKWAKELRDAYILRDWAAVEALLTKLETPTFSE